MPDWQRFLPPGAAVIHGSALSRGLFAVLLIGPSGHGKSTLSLELMAWGATLIADDGAVVSPAAPISRVAPAPSARRVADATPPAIRSDTAPATATSPQSEACAAPVGGGLRVACPPPLSGLIEARGIGLLRADPGPPAALVLVADLSRPPDRRLPEPAWWRHAGHAVPAIRIAGLPHAAAAILQILRHGWADGRDDALRAAARSASAPGGPDR